MMDEGQAHYSSFEIHNRRENINLPSLKRIIFIFQKLMNSNDRKPFTSPVSGLAPIFAFIRDKVGIYLTFCIIRMNCLHFIAAA